MVDNLARMIHEYFSGNRGFAAATHLHTNAQCAGKQALRSVDQRTAGDWQ